MDLEFFLRKVEELVKVIKFSDEILKEIGEWKSKFEGIILDVIKKYNVNFDSIKINCNHVTLYLDSSNVNIYGQVDAEETKKYALHEYWSHLDDVKRALVFKYFIENIPLVVKEIDREIRKLKSKNSKLRKILEEIKEILSPIVVSNELAK